MIQKLTPFQHHAAGDCTAPAGDAASTATAGNGCLLHQHQQTPPQLPHVLRFMQGGVMKFSLSSSICSAPTLEMLSGGTQYQ